MLERTVRPSSEQRDAGTEEEWPGEGWKLSTVKAAASANFSVKQALTIISFFLGVTLNDGTWWWYGGVFKHDTY